MGRATPLLARWFTVFGPTIEVAERDHFDGPCHDGHQFVDGVRSHRVPDRRQRATGDPKPRAPLARSLHRWLGVANCLAPLLKINVDSTVSDASLPVLLTLVAERREPSGLVGQPIRSVKRSNITAKRRFRSTDLLSFQSVRHSGFDGFIIE